MAVAWPARLEGAFVANEDQLAFQVRTPVGERDIQAIEKARLGTQLAAPKPRDFFVGILYENSRVVTVKAAAKV